MPMQTVGLREFRTNLHKYTSQGLEPVVVTSHGAAIGYFIPARPGPRQQELSALREAVRKLAALLASSGIGEEEILADFQKARQSELRAGV